MKTIFKKLFIFNVNKYVKKSTYQKVVEENKVMRKDLKSITSTKTKYTPESVLTIAKWRTIFDAEDRFNDWLVSWAKSSMKKKESDE